MMKPPSALGSRTTTLSQEVPASALIPRQALLHRVVTVSPPKRQSGLALLKAYLTCPQYVILGEDFIKREEPLG